jgi:hypothetical protein
MPPRPEPPASRGLCAHPPPRQVEARCPRYPSMANRSLVSDGFQHRRPTVGTELVVYAAPHSFDRGGPRPGQGIVDADMHAGRRFRPGGRPSHLRGPMVCPSLRGHSLHIHPRSARPSRRASGPRRVEGSTDPPGFPSRAFPLSYGLKVNRSPAGISRPEHWPAETRGPGCAEFGLRSRIIMKRSRPLDVTGRDGRGGFLRQG